MEWVRKARGFLNRSALNAELEEELRTHLEMKAEASADPSAARRQFGNTTLHLEDSRAEWRWASRCSFRSPIATATTAITSRR